MQAQAPSNPLHRQPRLTVLSALAVIIALAAVFALGVIPNEASAKVSFAGTLSGSNSQGNPGQIRVSGDGRKVKEASLTIEVKCPFGSFLLPQKVRGLTITPSGRFGGTGEDTSTDEGVTLHISESISGRFNADRTSVWVKSRLRLDFQAPDGTTETCDSGSVSLHATR